MRVVSVDEVKKCLDEVTGDDAKYAIALLEWAIEKREFEAVPKEIIDKTVADLERKREEAIKKGEYYNEYGLSTALEFIRERIGKKEQDHE